MLIAFSIPIGAQQALASSPTLTRLSGDGRIQTAVNIAQEGWPNGSRAVVLARGDSFPDALAGATLAAANEAPILLTDSLNLSSETQTEISALHPSKVFILGGPGAISPNIETSLKANYEVIRLGGNDRYETATNIASYLKANNLLKTNKAVIAYGENFPDALAISSWSANNGIPILLSDINSIPASTSNALSDLQISSTIIAGGSGVINTSVESKLPSPTRYGGSDRYDTAMKIANSLQTGTDKIFVATGENFPDALAGSALAAKTGSTIVLVDNGLPSTVSQFIANNKDKIKNVYILGGTGVVLPGSVDSILNTINGIVGGKLKVSFIDVGQGDSILIQTPSGKNLLIDGGKTDATTTVENYLRSSGVTSLDIIGTHPDSDHIGSLDSVVKDFTVNNVYMPNVINTSYTYEDLLNAIKAKGLTTTAAKAGLTIDLGSGIEAKFIAPVKGSYTELNNYSAVLKVTYGSNSFLLTGDAETESEADMIASGADLQSTVLKVGHHGSSSSTSEAFLNAVKPKYAVISVGENSYGHPTAETLTRLNNHGVQIYRTDKSGTIVAESDGTNITFNTTPSTPTIPSTPPEQTTANVVISNIDLNGEIVTLTNQSSTTADLTGWKLVSLDGNQTFSFPSGMTIAAGATLKVVSGPNATAGNGILVWTESYIWNNSGDTGVLHNSQGQEVSRY